MAAHAGLSQSASKHVVTRVKRGSPKARKRRFKVSVALERIHQAVAEYPKAALFDLAADGFDSTFEQLVACIISIRTRDEVTVPTARRLFAAARSARDVAKLRIDAIDRLIGTCTFHRPKAGQIRAIAERVLREFGPRNRLRSAAGRSGYPRSPRQESLGIHRRGLARKNHGTAARKASSQTLDRT
jgi:endonuclease III